MLRHAATSAGLLAALVFGCAVQARQVEPTAKIAVTAALTNSWIANYQLHRPATELVFERSPDASRASTWTAPPGFTFGMDARGEFVRRADGKPFQSVSFALPAAYRELPKDYAPFAPFGDGGMLFHSGRFFACPGACPDEGKSWAMTLRAPPGRLFIVDGRVAQGNAAWTDKDDGRYVYVGRTRPVQTTNTVAVIDRQLPEKIRSQLDTDLPRYMNYFATRLGALPQRPALFVSYDTQHGNGWGRQGGTLPGQIFVHFYGKNWVSEIAKPDFGFDLAWHLGHESGHFYQRGLIEPGKAGIWVHEGGAEAFAALAMGALEPADALRQTTKIAAARTACAAATSARSLRDVSEDGDFKAPYSCGLILNLALHRAIMAKNPKSDGLFAVWRAMIADRRGEVGKFDRAVRSVAGACVADAIKAAVALPGGTENNTLTQCDD